MIAGEEDLDQDQLRRPPVPQHGRSTLDADVGSGDGDSGPSPSTGDPRLGSRYHGGCVLEVDLIYDLDHYEKIISMAKSHKSN